MDLLAITPICRAIIDANTQERIDAELQMNDRVPAIELFMRGRSSDMNNVVSTQAASRTDGFKRLRRCNAALECMDRQGWDRSYLWSELYTAV
jgi:hypothetical protein